MYKVYANNKILQYIFYSLFSSMNNEDKKKKKKNQE